MFKKEKEPGSRSTSSSRPTSAPIARRSASFTRPTSFSRSAPPSWTSWPAAFSSSGVCRSYCGLK